MKVLTANPAWFSSEEGRKVFSDLQSLEERAVFIYSYLRGIANKSFETDSILFKTAFLIADGILGSTLPYATYPAVVDSTQNPFAAYLANGEYTDEQTVYYSFLSILHGIADPLRKDNWIYNKELCTSDELPDHLKELGHNFCDQSESLMVDPAAFEIDEALKLIQLKIIWLFNSQVKGR